MSVDKIAGLVKPTEYGPPPSEGIASLKERSQYLTPALLQATENLQPEIYLFQSGQDPLTGGVAHEAVDPAIFSSMEVLCEAKSFVEFLTKTFQKRWPTADHIHAHDAQFYGELDEITNPYKSKFGFFYYSQRITRLDMNIVLPTTPFGTLSSFAALAAIRGIAPEGMEFVRFNRQIQQCNPHLFPPEKSYLEIAETNPWESPSKIGVIPGYTYITTFNGTRRCVRFMDVSLNQSWKMRSSTGVARTMDADPIKIFFQSPILSQERTSGQNLVSHEFGHLWDSHLKKRNPDLHHKLHGAAEEAVQCEKNKEGGRTMGKKLADILGGKSFFSRFQKGVDGSKFRGVHHSEINEIIAHTAGYVFSGDPSEKLKILETYDRKWKKKFQEFIKIVESWAIEKAT